MADYFDTPLFFSRADANTVSANGAVLRTRLGQALQLPKNARHTVYLDQLAAVNAFNNCSSSLGNASVDLAPVDPSKWTITSRPTSPITVSYHPYGGGGSLADVTIPVGEYLLTTLVNDIDAAFIAQGHYLYPSLNASTLSWTWGGLGMGSISYSSGSESDFNTELRWLSEPDPTHVFQAGEIPPGNYDFETATTTLNELCAVSLTPISGVCIVTISLDTATGGLKIEPDASNTHILDLRPGKSLCLRKLFGFAPSADAPVWLNAAAGVATYGGGPYNVALLNSYDAPSAATFDKFATLQLHTPLANSVGSNGEPSNAISQFCIDVGVGHQYSYHPPRTLLVPATPAFSIDNVSVSLQTPDGTQIETDEDWSCVIVVRSQLGVAAQ
jgi:hypothetical protein